MRPLLTAAVGLLFVAVAGWGESVRAAETDGTRVSIVAAGDIADCGADGTQFPYATYTAALVEPTDAAILTLGDNTYPIGAPKEFEDCFQPIWGRFRERIRPSPGNHDYMTTDADGYYDYFGDAAGPGRRGYYSFDLGHWHVISLNSNVDAGVGSAQYAWLQADLATSDAPCTLAYWHHPLFTSGPHGNDPRMAAIFRLLHDAGAEIVLVGHDHLYERFAPQDASGQPDPERGIRSFTVGTGGARLYSLRAPQPNSEARDDSTHGVLRLVLGADDYEWNFMPANGGPPRDHGRSSCHR